MIHMGNRVDLSPYVLLLSDGLHRGKYVLSIDLSVYLLLFMTNNVTRIKVWESESRQRTFSGKSPYCCVFQGSFLGPFSSSAKSTTGTFRSCLKHNCPCSPMRPHHTLSIRLLDFNDRLTHMLRLPRGDGTLLQAQKDLLPNRDWKNQPILSQQSEVSRAPFHRVTWLTHSWYIPQKTLNRLNAFRPFLSSRHVTCHLGKLIVST